MRSQVGLPGRLCAALVPQLVGGGLQGARQQAHRAGAAARKRLFEELAGGALPAAALGLRALGGHPGAGPAAPEAESHINQHGIERMQYMKSPC